MVQLLAHRRRPPQHELPGRQPEPERHRRRRHAGNPPGINLPNRRRGQRSQALRSNAEINNDANVDTGDGDAHGDINTFWRERDYNLDPSKIKASVFATHGFQDDNVRMDHEGMWWDTLDKAGVERKLWLLRTGHTDPFESRRAVWVDTLHRWFDHYLFAVNNGIEKEPNVTVEEAEGRLEGLHDLADQRHPERRPVPARHG